MISKKIYSIINISMAVVFIAILLFSLTSSALLYDKASIIWMMLIGVFLFCLYFPIKKSRKVKKFLLKISRYQTTIFWSIFGILIIYQLFLQKVLPITPKYDSLLMIRGITDSKILGPYFSLYPNNEFFYFFNQFLRQFSTGNVLLWERLVDIVLSDIAIVLFKILCGWLFHSKSIGNLAGLFFILYVGIQPLFLVPYTDTYVLPFLMGALLCLLATIRCKTLNNSIVFAGLAGILSCVTYLMRPSAITYIIALAFFLLIGLKEIKAKRKLAKTIISTLSFSFFFLLCLLSFHDFIAHQKQITVQTNQQASWEYFLLLGSYGNENQRESIHGVWNTTDVALLLKKGTPSAKNTDYLNALKKRTEARGLGGTLEFYLMKFSNNVDTGVIGYHRDGLWLLEKTKTSGPWKWVQEIYYPEGKYRPRFDFILSVIWIVTVLFCIATLWRRRKSRKIAFIALSFFGGLLFLELFESGGTKYLLQYIPFVCMLAAVGARDFLIKGIRKL